MSTINLSLPLRTRLANHKADKDYANHSDGLEAGGNCFDRPCVWFTDLAKLERVWRFKGYADEITHSRERGWYTDNFQDGVCRGIVAQLPARNGQSVYLAGFACTDSDTVCLFPESYDDDKDAAYSALSWAERYAEDSRDGDAQQLAEMQIDDLKQENASLRADNKSLRIELAEVRKCGHKVAAKTIRERIKDNKATIARNESRIGKLKDNYYLAVS